MLLAVPPVHPAANLMNAGNGEVISLSTSAVFWLVPAGRIGAGRDPPATSAPAVAPLPMPRSCLASIKQMLSQYSPGSVCCGGRQRDDRPDHSTIHSVGDLRVVLRRVFGSAPCSSAVCCPARPWRWCRRIATMHMIATCAACLAVTNQCRCSERPNILLPRGVAVVAAGWCC